MFFFLFLGLFFPLVSPATNDVTVLLCLHVYARRPRDIHVANGRVRSRANADQGELEGLPPCKVFRGAFVGTGALDNEEGVFLAAGLNDAGRGCRDCEVCMSEGGRRRIVKEGVLVKRVLDDEAFLTPLRSFMLSYASEIVAKF